MVSKTNIFFSGDSMKVESVLINSKSYYFVDCVKISDAALSAVIKAFTTRTLVARCIVTFSARDSPFLKNTLATVTNNGLNSLSTRTKKSPRWKRKLRS